VKKVLQLDEGLALVLDLTEVCRGDTPQSRLEG
jgi:hypothetical protein